MSVETNDERYAALCDYACRTARDLLAAAAVAAPPTPSARYILAQSRALTGAYADGQRPRPDCAAADALDVITAAWSEICTGADTGELLFQRHWLLWHRLMSEWPMGHYADLVASALAAVDGPLGTVLELGAGVGATTRLIRPLLADRGAVIATDLMYAAPNAVDFDRPLRDQVPGVDGVVATNALHCARDLPATLDWIREVIKPGGWLIIGEGAPYPEPGVPWALNLIFGACRGWYDRPGFREPHVWQQVLGAAGFDEVVRSPIRSERFELGGSFTAR